MKDIKKENKIKTLVKVTCDHETKNNLIENFGQQYEFYFAQEDASVFDKQIESAEIIIGEPSQEELLRAKALRWLQLTWAGADKHVCMKHASQNLCITNASGAFGKIIAEFAIGGIIAIYRSFPQYFENQKKCMWQRIDTADIIYEKKALILGTGDIGQNVAQRLKAFGAETVGIRRVAVGNLPEYFDKVYGIEDLDRLLPEADIVIGCLPNTAETMGLLDYNRLHLMKKAAVLVNVGRGNLIESDVLAKVLREGHLKGAVLDVLDVEPLPQDSPLWDAPNIFITPHISGPSFGGNSNVQETIWKICFENLKRYQRGESLLNVVNPQKGY